GRGRFDHPFKRDDLMPKLEGAAVGEAGHPVTILTHRCRDDVLDRSTRNAHMLTGDRKACGEPFHVPLPRPTCGLIEVVEIENQLPLGCRESAEVHEVRVTTNREHDS